MAQVCGPAEDRASPEEIVALPTITSTESDESAPLRVLAFDTQNTFARLFSRSLSNHLTCKPGCINHPYAIAATLGPERIHLQVGKEQTRELWMERVNSAPERIASMTYERATNKLLRDADKLEQKGRTLFVTEYAPFAMKRDILLSTLRSKDIHASRSSNPTVIPDDLLKLFNPIIFIQHPAIVVPAWLRVARTEYGSYTVDDDDFTIWTSLRWSRLLFDHLRSSTHLKQSSSTRVDSAHSTQSARFQPEIVATRPYVIDAADVENNTYATLAAVCRLLGIEFSGGNSTYLSYFSRAAEAFKKAIPDSLLKVFGSSVLSTSAYSIDIDREMVQWREEFGDQAAKMLKAKVEDDMPHYEYLKSFRLRILPVTGLPLRRQSAADERADYVVGNPLRMIRSAVDGQRRERHFSC